MKYLSAAFLTSFVSFVKSTRITGDDATDEKGMGLTKTRFKRDSMKILREIADRIGLVKGEFEIRFNKGGPAVSGDPILHGDRIYVCMSQFGDTFYYRSCKGRKDYTGGPNKNLRWDSLTDLQATSAAIFGEMYESPRGLQGV